MEIPVYVWKLEADQNNPLTKAEAENVQAEADIHKKIPGEYYAGMADGMEDIKKEYSKNPVYGWVVEFRHGGQIAHQQFPTEKAARDFIVRKKIQNKVISVSPIIRIANETISANPVVSFDRKLDDAIRQHQKMFGSVARRLMDIRLVPKDHIFNGSPETYVITSAKGTSYHQRRYLKNPVVPFRQKAISSTGKRTSPETMLRTQLWNVAQTVTNDPQKAAMLVDAFYDVIAQRQSHALKGKLIPFGHNPAGGMIKIYERCIEIKASKAGLKHHCDEKCRRAGHNYKHGFAKKACIYGLPDGSLLIR
jgi:hypothetical protein